MGPGTLSILAIFLSFAVLAFTISKGLKPYQAILSACAVIIGFYFFKLPPSKLFSSTFLNYPNMRTFGIVVFMLLLIGFMKYYGLTDRIAEAAKGVFREKKWTVILIPSLIGAIPMPAGALISATLLKDILEELRMPPEISTASNYWFRHIWEYFWFFYQSIIFESLITGVPLLKVMALQAPFTLTGMGIGILYYLRGVSGRGERKKGAGKELLFGMWPVLAIICSVVGMKGISSIAKLPFSSADFLFWTIPAVIVAMVIKYGEGKEGIKKASKSLSPSMLAAVLSALLYKSSVICSGAATDFSSFMIAHHVPPLLLLSSIPFIAGLLTGISFVAVTISFPIILPFISQHPLAYVPLAYAFAHFGMMLSPAHLCLILSNEYFGAKLSKSYRYVFPVTAGNTAIAFAISMAYLYLLRSLNLIYLLPPSCFRKGGLEMPKEGIFTASKMDLSEWYNQVIEAAGLIDKRYPVKGANVWLPYGWKIMRFVDEKIREEIEKRGHQEVCFPTLIPESFFKKEAEHIKGFEGQVFWITHGGTEPLEERLLLRPTSESAMYSLFSLWIRTHADLPLKIYQIVNVFRYETKQTRAFIRMREFHFFEAHTAHKDYDEAEEEVKGQIEVALRVIRDCLRIPCLVSIRPDWDKFAGAHYSVALDAVMPDGRTMQVATVHHYKDNFARAYSIKYKDEQGEEKYVHQTTFGMSERLIGAMVMVHGDDHGLIIPSQVAPIQAVIIPIIFKGEEEAVLERCRKILEMLKEGGIRAHLDDREETPGSKYYYWELRGVPLRIEIGPREVRSNSAVIVLRPNREKIVARTEEIVGKVREGLKRVDEILLERAEEEMRKRIVEVDSLEEAKKALEGGRRVLVCGWCGSEECAEKIMESLDVKILGRDYYGRKEHKKCIVCGRESPGDIYLAKTY